MILRTVLAATVAVAAFPVSTSSAIAAEPKLRTVCDAFRKLDATPAYLRQIDIYEGAVSDNATLAPDTSDEADGKLINTWTFQAGSKITVVCSYGAPKQVRVLPKTATVCRATFVATSDARKWKPSGISCG